MMKDTLCVLIVDDDRRMTRTLADILTIHGYQAEEANSAGEALDINLRMNLIPV